MTVSLDVMLSKPGIYLVIAPFGMSFCETMPGGKCHQLNPHTFERDGELSTDGWAKPVAIYGPLARAFEVDDLRQQIHETWQRRE